MLSLILEREERRERERNTDVREMYGSVDTHMLPNQDEIHNLDVCSDQKLNLNSLVHRGQTQGPWAESGPPPCFIQPGTLFLSSCSAELLDPS